MSNELKIRHLTYLGLILLLFHGFSQAANSTASSLMSQAMLSMMDAMGNLAQDYHRNKGWSPNYYSQPLNSWQGLNYSPWGMSPIPGGGVPGQQQIQGLINQTPGAPQGMTSSVPPQLVAPQKSPLDGIWQSQGGEMVLVMYGHFRIYANADSYRDGRYEIINDRLIMLDPETGATRSFEFALSEGRLVLRGQDGQLLLFRQLPIPIPPYALFAGQHPNSTQQQSDTDKDQKYPE